MTRRGLPVADGTNERCNYTFHDRQIVRLARIAAEMDRHRAVAVLLRRDVIERIGERRATATDSISRPARIQRDGLYVPGLSLRR
jgi:hypothetical protein